MSLFVCDGSTESRQSRLKVYAKKYAQSKENVCVLRRRAGGSFSFYFRLSSLTLLRCRRIRARKESGSRESESFARKHTPIGLIDADEMCCWEVFRRKRDEKNKHGERSEKLLHGNMARAPNAKVAPGECICTSNNMAKWCPEFKVGRTEGTRGVLIQKCTPKLCHKIAPPPIKVSYTNT